MGHRSRRQWTLAARGLLVLVAVLLLPLAAMVQTPGESKAESATQDTLWAGWVFKLEVCADPSSPAALASCFGSPLGTQGVNVRALATDGVNVYFAGVDGGLSCPIADLGENCTRIMAGPWPKGYNCTNRGKTCDANEVTALAAGDGYLWFAQKTHDIYRCPVNLPYTQQDSAPGACVKLDDGGGHAITSLLLANGTLYAGLESQGSGVVDSKEARVWKCDPNRKDACGDLDKLGNDSVKSLAVGGGYLWAGTIEGTILRCDPARTNSCTQWEDAGNGKAVEALSYDGAGLLYAGVAGYTSGTEGKGVVWSCLTASANRCSDLLHDKDGTSVAAGAGSVFSTANGDQYFATSRFTAGRIPAAKLLYIPAAGPVGVGAASVSVRSAPDAPLTGKGCTQQGKNPKAILTVQGPNAFSMTKSIDACGLRDGAASSRSFQLLDPGDYTVTVRSGTYSGQAAFTVESDKITRVTVEIVR